MRRGENERCVKLWAQHSKMLPTVATEYGDPVDLCRTLNGNSHFHTQHVQGLLKQADLGGVIGIENSARFLLFPTDAARQLALDMPDDLNAWITPSLSATSASTDTGVPCFATGSGRLPPS